MKRYKSKFKEIGYILPEVENFGFFFVRNAIEHYDYDFIAVDYKFFISGKPLLYINFSVDECYPVRRKTEGSVLLEHKKTGAVLSIYFNTLKVIDMYQYKDVLTVTCELPMDKNNGTYNFVFKKREKQGGY